MHAVRTVPPLLPTAAGLMLDVVEAGIRPQHVFPVLDIAWIAGDLPMRLPFATTFTLPVMLPLTDALPD
jgi:hypothetical protein